MARSRSEGSRPPLVRGRPTWLVLPAGRFGRDTEAQAWLNRRCRLEATIRRPRLDYDEYVLDVYKFDPPAPD
ncbi:hypothetical protein J0H58_39360 [bacterium]|nr:hypothetical protein [bacterium]